MGTFIRNAVYKDYSAEFHQPTRRYVIYKTEDPSFEQRASAEEVIQFFKLKVDVVEKAKYDAVKYYVGKDLYTDFLVKNTFELWEHAPKVAKPLRREISTRRELMRTAFTESAKSGATKL